MIADMIRGITGGFFLLLAFVYLLRLIQAWLLHRTLREAISRDSPLATTLVDRIGSGDIGAPPRATIGSDDRTGLVLLAFGLALAGFALVVGDPDWVRYGLGGALFPVLVGAALLLRHYLLRRAAERDLAAGE
jgi:hypothetical protein